MPTGLSFDDIRNRVTAALNQGRGDGNRVYVRDLYRDEAIYEDLSGLSGGKIYRRSVSVTDAGEVTLGDDVEEVQERRVYEPVTVAAFSMDPAEFSEDGEYVTWTGKLFEAGDYPDKRFSITEEELAEAAAEYVPVFNDLEHVETILSKKKAIGRLVSVFARGAELFGTVTVPKWLHNLMEPGEPLKVSLAWTLPSKRIVGNALTLNPRIKDAQLQAAFSAATAEPADSRKEKTLMNLIQRLMAVFKSATPEELAEFNGDVTPPPTPPAPPANDTKDAEIARLRSENEALAARQAQADEARVAEVAKTFAAQAVAVGKILPTQADALAAQFAQAVKDDNAGKACFSEAGVVNAGDRVTNLRGLVESMPKNPLAGERARAQVLFGEDGTDNAVNLDTADVYARRAKAHGR
jgi:hypothetical protein